MVKGMWHLQHAEQPELTSVGAACRKALHRATFRGPALFTPVVQAARDLVEQLSLVCYAPFTHTPEPASVCRMQPALCDIRAMAPHLIVPWSFASE